MSKRSGQSMASKNLESRNCAMCNNADTNKMVACDQCDAWFHFNCVNVTASIAKEDWSCAKCTTMVLPNDGIQSKTPSVVRSSIKSQRLKRTRVELRLLEERRQLQKQRDEEYLQKKFELLMQEEEDEETSRDGDQEEPHNRVGQWLQNEQGFTPGQQRNDADKNAIFNAPQASNQQEFSTQPPISSKIPSQTKNFISHPSNLQYFDKCNNNNVMPKQEIQNPNQHQIAARQSLPTELPIFSGDPDEWALFFSTFESTTKICGFNNDDNLIRLRKCLKGKALNVVRNRLSLPSNVPRVMSTLRTLFGRPELIINTILQKIRQSPPLRNDKLEQIVEFAFAVENLCTTMEASALHDHLNNQLLLQELTDMLPTNFKMMWAVHKRSLKSANLSRFDEWLSEMAESISDVTYSPLVLSEYKSYKRPKEKGHVHLHAETHHDNTNSKQLCQICNNICVSVDECSVFLQLSRNERWEAVKQHHLCRMCLKSHRRAQCKVNKVCGINGCTFRHHSLLHNFNINPEQIIKTKNTEPGHNEVVTNKKFTHNSCNKHSYNESEILFRYIPINLFSRNKMVRAYAFLDDGSSLTMMEDSLADELELTGQVEPLLLKWTGGTHREESGSRIISVDISGIDETHPKFSMTKVRTVKSLSLPSQSVDAAELALHHPHLRGIPISSYHQAVPRLLIGLDNTKLATSLKVREGHPTSPVASKTRLGWMVYGPKSTYIKSTTVISHEFHSYHICKCERSNDELLQHMLKEYFSLDSLGVTKIDVIKSANEERACKILEEQTHRKGNFFETALLWKYDDIQLPDSFPMALRRYKCLKKRLERDPDLTHTLNQLFEDYQAKGYIRKLTSEEISQHYPRKWYLPIFVVTNKNKPGKSRIVWDAAAKANGTSLNSVLLKGPDQLVPLTGILFRFQERRIAICGDIREMFHQVRVNSYDQHSQRFLWSNEGSNNPDIYVMQVLTFGATCSPSCAQFVKNRNAQEYASEFRRAANSIIHNHYVDDFLESVDSEEEAVQLARDVKYVHQRGGFEIRHWISNSSRVVNVLGEQHCERWKLNLKTENDAEKVLGLWWCTSPDTFTFSLTSKSHLREQLSENYRPTKREVLRVLMSIYDPLGFIANFMVFLKILMQEIWRSKVGWDDRISDEHLQQWQLWVRHLKNINQVQIPRCYLHGIRFSQHESAQLHVFVDASENAFAAVAYIRVSQANLIETRIIAAKTRVAPLNLVSIPRLELEAARLGVRLAKNIKEGHSIDFNHAYYWTDSKTVLSWIQSDHRKYRPFVAFRVSEILEDSTMQQWRYVNTKLNVADDATKWQKLPEFNPSSRWFTGPSFLMQSEDGWPPLKDFDQTQEEMRASHLLHHTNIPPALIQFKRFSKWNRLVRAQVYVLRFIWNISAKRRGVPKISNNFLTKEEYVEAQNYLFKVAQSDCYSDEIATLSENKSLPAESRRQVEKSSPVFKLSPYVDEHGVLRIRGRIDAAVGVSNDLKRPIILPKRHHITTLIIKSYHERYHHHNNETVINEIRQKFYIPNLRVVTKTVRNMCQLCKNQKATPRPPEMGNLPPARLSSFTRPFSCVGIDYFGPMYVTIGRSIVKRWGVLITCMTTRAIHLEVASSLSSDSCILAIRRFIARRGRPKEIRCDNGTNFHGAEKEIQSALRNQKDDLANEFSSPETKWIYNPPASPHMGGCWERLVQSVKKTLNQIMLTKNPSDELLLSMLLEVEFTVNSRPLTYIPVDINNLEVLTPNHFLLGTSNGEKPDGINCDDGIILRKNWLKSQQFVNTFWKRWVREYLPTLTRRTKWFQPVKPIAKGDVVVIIDESNPRNSWPKGRVISTICGKDGQVRRATVQTSNGIYERPAVKLAVLDVINGKSASEEETSYQRGECWQLQR